MWTRTELKAKAKFLVRQQYWWMVLISFILLFVSGSGSGAGSRAASNSNSDTSSITEGINGIQSGDISLSLVLMIVIGIIIFSIIFIAIFALIRAFVLNPIYVGCLRFILNAREGRRNFNDVVFAFNNSYLNIVKVMFLRDLKVFLWTLLLIIPGIVKSYEYSMIPYILAENPAIDSNRVFELTKVMTNNDKLNIFVLGLSFLPWQILSAITCFIVGIFWVNPYVNATMAELYIELREKAFRLNAVAPNELYSYTYKGALY